MTPGLICYKFNVIFLKLNDDEKFNNNNNKNNNNNNNNNKLKSSSNALKQSPKNRNLDQTTNNSKPHVCNTFFENIILGIQL